MAGSSNRTLRIDYVNANWNAEADAACAFELLIVTEDGQRHSLPIAADHLTALGPLLRQDGVLLFDPEGQTIIVGNLVGEWFQQDWSQGDHRVAVPAR
ncbi:hypothetical protein [Allobranchiibius sp. CTAmp26]|uniref:hypothetical protein n=1 Tax=Allobranchiibius sp. CTAmp26 TaxID=2815214 RepID=UPI001AA16F2F|nr:hypothetical protein [Allobranchiibius sp. CTAmp26]MBO1756354.1 hypothetical protein [Allobranchiibius sp. CTAmp26]